MSGEIAVVAAQLKEAERLTEIIKNKMLTKAKLENFEFDREVLDSAYGVLDQLMYINSETSIGSYIAQVVERIEEAEEIMSMFGQRGALPMHNDNHIILALEGFHEINSNQ